MNDAAEFDTSLTGAIDFFQNLRRKLGTLDAETGVQHDQLQGLAAAVATIRQDQQQAEQAITALADHLRAQGDALREELQTALEQRAPADQITLLETQLARQTENLHDLQEAMLGLVQDAPLFRDRIESLATRLEQLEPLAPAVATGQAQWQQLQQELAGLKDDLESQRLALTDAGQIQQSLQRQQDRLKHVETFMGKVAADTNSTRQILNLLQTDLTTQNDTLREFDQFWRDSFAATQDRALPATVTAPSLDETGAPESATVALDQQRLEELTTAIAAASEEHTGIQQELAAVQAALTEQGERLNGQDASLAALRSALWGQLQNQQDQLGELASALNELRDAPAPAAETDQLAADLSTLRETLTPRIETLDELQQSAQRQIQSQWDQISQLEAALNDLRQAPASTTGLDAFAADLTVLNETLTPRIDALDEAQQKLRHQIQTQQDQFGELASALHELQQTPVPTAETEPLAADLGVLRETLTSRIETLDELQQSAQRQIQNQWDQISELETALNDQRQAPAATTEMDAFAADLTVLNETLTPRIEALDEVQQELRHRIQTQQDQLGDLAAAINKLRQGPVSEGESQLFNAELTTLHQALAEQSAALVQLQRATDQRFAELNMALEAQRLAEMQRELIQPAAQSTAPSSVDEDLQQHLSELQDAVTGLENRLVSQAQAFSGNFEQFRGLRGDIQAVQDHIAKLESTPRQLTAIEQHLADQEQEVAQLKDVLQQVQTDTQQLFEAALQDGAPQALDLEARLVNQSEQLEALNSAVETIRTDAKATQDKVVTMASNVAKRMHEFQNQMTAIETTQGERLQELEQKIIWLQAALETVENQRKPRRWFSMPASLTVLILTVSATLMALATQAIRAAG